MPMPQKGAGLAVDGWRVVGFAVNDSAAATLIPTGTSRFHLQSSPG
jgi:hypothetical protein